MSFNLSLGQGEPLTPIGIFDKDFFQILIDCTILRVQPKPNATFTKHPIETVQNISTVSDNRVLNQTEIEIDLFIPPGQVENLYQQIEALYLNATPLIIQTQERTFESQFIYSIPYERTAEMINASIINIKTIEIQFATTLVTEYQPKDPLDKQQSNRGNLQPTPATPKQRQTTFQNIVEGGNNLIKKIF